MVGVVVRYTSLSSRSLDWLSIPSIAPTCTHRRSMLVVRSHRKGRNLDGSSSSSIIIIRVVG